MAFKLSQTQKTYLNQQMRLSVAILQMGAAQLETYIADACQENPFLDYIPIAVPFPLEKAGTDSDAYLDVINEQHKRFTVNEYLQEQIAPLHIPQKTRKLLLYLVEDLDKRGYLASSAEEIALILHISVSEAEAGIARLQQLDPAGIGARSLEECLKLQIARLEGDNGDAMCLCDNLELMAQSSAKMLQRKLGWDEARYAAAREVLLSLNPLPANGFAPQEDIGYTNADLIVEKDENGNLSVSLNDDAIPSVSLNSEYLRTLKELPTDTEEKAYIRNRMQHADTIMQGIGRRKRTLLTCGQIILEKQTDFFSQGPSALRPFGLQELADRLGVHVSTASRTVQNKFLLCDLGIFPLSTFFPRSALRDGSDITAADIKLLIRHIISGEDPAHPYSDRKMVQLLEEQGIVISRRAVAKYREQMGIASTVGRRQ